MAPRRRWYQPGPVLLASLLDSHSELAFNVFACKAEDPSFGTSTTATTIGRLLKSNSDPPRQHPRMRPHARARRSRGS